LAGKNAFEMISKDLTSKKFDTTYYSSDNTSLYIYNNAEIISYEENPFKIWMMYFDLVKTKWTIASMDTTIDFNGVPFKQTITATVERTSNTTAFIFKTKSYPTVEFKMNMDMVMSGDIPGIGKFESKIKMVGYMTVAKGLGMVKTKTTTMSSDPQDGYSRSDEESILIDSSIK
jgi:hypothetical protein